MFFRILEREQISHTSFSPTYLRLLLGSPEIGRLATSSLVTMNLGGEALTMADLRALWAAAPELRVFNRYGQTETTIAVTTYRLDRETMADATRVPIGTPNRASSSSSPARTASSSKPRERSASSTSAAASS